MRCSLRLGSLALMLLACTVAGQKSRGASSSRIRPLTGKATNYQDLAFYPERWKDANASFRMLAFRGRNVALVTKRGRYDKKKIAAFVKRLDDGWDVYRDLIGEQPRQFRHIDGKATICALPRTDLTCGWGCGYVGSTGIEVAGFYTKDWPRFQQSPNSFEHYYFYEMGRNFFVFGDRHSLFRTGYAVFMRYVCMDQLGCDDPDAKTRKTIESCEELLANSKLPFFDAFTNFGAGEKAHRLEDGDGRAIQPSDQPVIYAAAMLKLRRDYGGDTWVKRFFHSLRKCEPGKATDVASADKQVLNWLACASMAATKDLSPVFCDRWRLPLEDRQRQLLRDTDWTDEKLHPAKVVAQLLGKR